MKTEKFSFFRSEPASSMPPMPNRHFFVTLESLLFFIKLDFLQFFSVNYQNQKLSSYIMIKNMFIGL